MTTLGPRFSSPSASYMPTASPMYLPASRNRASNVTVANDLNTRTSKAEPKPTVVPGGLTTLQTRATSSEVCRNFLIDRCIWGSSCHRVHVLPPLESHPPVESRATLSKTPSDSDSRPSKVVATEYVVKIPNPRFQAQMPLVRLNSQRSCFDATDPNARTPVVRLRSRSSECPPENLSQDSFPDPNLDPDMRRYCDLNSSMWASKTGEISWASDGENPSQNAPYDDLNSWGYRAQDSSWSAQIPSRIDVPGKDRDTDNDLNSWGSRADESSWTTDGVENPSQLTPRPHDADLNSWGSKTEESSWTADGAENLTPTRLTPRSHLHGADLNSWGLKTKENSWGNAGSSSSLTENSSSIATLSSQPPPTRNPEINRLPLLDSQICRDWARGNCTYGQRCRFVHGGLNNRGPPGPPSSAAPNPSSSSEQPTLVENQSQPTPGPHGDDYDLNSWGRTTEESSWGTVGLSVEDSESSSSVSAGTISSQSSTRNPSQTEHHPPPTARQTCYDWMKGRCAFGPRCKWAHPDLNHSLPGPPLSAASSVRPTLIENQSQPTPGPHAALNSWCAKADESSWGNVGSSSDAGTVSSQSSFTRNPSQTELIHSHLPPPNPQSCRNWLRGSCHYGERCKFVHRDLKHNSPGPPSSAASSVRPTLIENQSQPIPGPHADLSSRGSRIDERSWTPECTENPNQPTLGLHTDLNSWGAKTDDSSWTAKIPNPLTPRPADLNSWGSKVEETSWGNAGLSSDGSSSTRRASSQSSSARNRAEMEMKHPRPPNPQTCRAWMRGSCTSGPKCRWVHGDLNYDLPGPTSSASRPSSCSTETASSRSSAPCHPQRATKHPPPPNAKTCHAWLRDDCNFGYECKYVHGDLDYDFPDPRSSTPPRSHHSPPPKDHHPPPPPESDLTITVHDHTKVKIGSGFEIHDITTGVETPWLILSKIPARVTPGGLEQLLSPFGSVLDVKLPTAPAKDFTIAKARFASHAEALHASNALDGSTFLKTRISARLPVNSRSGMASIQDCSVRIQWEAPQKVAYGGYPTLERAQEAIAVAAKNQCGDYHVYAAVHIGLPSIGIFTVKFANLPPTANEDFMQRFAAPEDIMWERPNYVVLAPAIDGIKRILRNLGNLLDVEVLPPPYSHGLVRAWATFSSSTAAKAGAGVLHNRKPVFTGKTRILAHHVQTLAYNLSLDEYYNNTRLIDSLRESLFRKGARMAIATRRQPLSMLIRLSAEGVKALGWLKAEFEKILRGEILRSDGVAVWDFFFVRPDGQVYLRGVEAKEPNVRIEADKVRRTLKVFGLSSSRAAIRAILLQKMSDLKAQQVRLIRLPGRIISVFFATQLSRLCETFGNDSVFVDIRERTLTLRGDDKLYEAGVEAVHQAQQSPQAQRPYVQNIAECPVCFNKVVSPITLGCGHKWCRACLSQYLLAALDNRHFPLSCLGDEAKCTQSISLSVARTILQPNEFNSIVEASIAAYVHAHAKELHYCPSPDCIQIYRTGPKGTVVQCPSCLLRICTHCHAEAHDGFMCAEQDGDKLFREWAASHDVKNCPGCAIPIERDEGCHHVTCIQCQTHICWVCLQTFPKGEGIYRHMREEHGGIGLAEHE